MKVYYFTHIPKAAGNSVKRALERQFPAAERYSIVGHPFRIQKSIDEYCALPDETKQRHRCVMGHVPFGIHEFGPSGSEPVYLAFLRHPVARAISQYHYIQEPRKDVIRQWLQMTPEDFRSLESYLAAERRQGLHNLQTRILSGTMGVAAMRAPYGPLGENALDKAKANIEKFYPVVGLQERFEESLILLRSRLGWSRVSWAKSNITKAKAPREEIPEELIRTIERDNAMDMALHAWCSERLGAAVAAEGETFERERARFRRRSLVDRTLGRIRRTLGGK